MPVNAEHKVTVECDNPNCPGHDDLDPTDRTGWFFVNSEIYGQPTQQHVFGNAECAAAAATDANHPFGQPVEMPQPQQTQVMPGQQQEQSEPESEEAS